PGAVRQPTSRPAPPTDAGAPELGRRCHAVRGTRVHEKVSLVFLAALRAGTQGYRHMDKAHGKDLPGKLAGEMGTGTAICRASPQSSLCPQIPLAWWMSGVSVSSLGGIHAATR